MAASAQSVEPTVQSLSMFISKTFSSCPPRSGITQNKILSFDDDDADGVPNERRSPGMMLEDNGAEVKQTEAREVGNIV